VFGEAHGEAKDLVASELNLLVAALVSHVETLTGLPSRWNGETGLAFSSFFRFPGFEEGVVEWLTRRFGPQTAREMNQDTPFERVAFERYLGALESLRQACGRSAEAFYLELLRTPLKHPQETVVQWIPVPYEVPV